MGWDVWPFENPGKKISIVYNFVGGTIDLFFRHWCLLYVPKNSIVIPFAYVVIVMWALTWQGCIREWLFIIFRDDTFMYLAFKFLAWHSVLFEPRLICKLKLKYVLYQFFQGYIFGKRTYGLREFLRTFHNQRMFSRCCMFWWESLFDPFMSIKTIIYKSKIMALKKLADVWIHILQFSIWNLAKKRNVRPKTWMPMPNTWKYRLYYFHEHEVCF
jgi:hypothetical protein